MARPTRASFAVWRISAMAERHQECRAYALKRPRADQQRQVRCNGAQQ